MKRIKTREIIIEIERVSINRKQPITKKPKEAKEKQNTEFETFGCANAFAKNGNRLEQLFDRLF